MLHAIYARGGDFFHYIAHNSCRLHLELSFTILFLFMQWLYLRSVRFAPVSPRDENDYGISWKFFLGLLTAWGLYLFGSLAISGGHLFEELATTGFPYAIVYILMNLAIGSLMIVVGVHHLRLKLVNTQRATNWIRTWGVLLTERLLVAELVCGALVLGYAYTYVYLLKYAFPIIGALGAALAIVWLIRGRGIVRSRWQRAFWVLGSLITYFGFFCLMIAVFHLFRPESASIKLKHFLHAMPLFAIGWLTRREVHEKGSSKQAATRHWLLLAVSIAAIGFTVWFRLQCKSDVARLRQATRDAVHHLENYHGHFAVALDTINPVKLQGGEGGIVEAVPREKEYFLERQEIDPQTHQKASSGDSDEPGFSGAMNLYVDARVKWASLAASMEAASIDHYKSVFFVFAKSELPSSARENPFIREEYELLVKTEPDLAATIILPWILILRVCDTCAHISNTSLAYSGYCTAAEKTLYIIQDLPDALEGCNCMADMDAVTWLLWRMISVSWYLSVRVDIYHEAAEGVAEVALDADMPWSEAHHHVLDVAKKTRRMRFVATNQ